MANVAGSPPLAVPSHPIPVADVIVTAPPDAWATMGGQLLDPPSAGSNADGRIIVTGVGLDHRLWRIEQTAPSNGWGDWAPVGQSAPPLRGRAAIARNGDGRVEVFATGGRRPDMACVAELGECSRRLVSLVGCG